MTVKMAPNGRLRKSRKEQRKPLQISKDDLKFVGIKQKLVSHITTTSRDYDIICLAKYQKTQYLLAFSLAENTSFDTEAIMEWYKVLDLTTHVQVK